MGWAAHGPLPLSRMLSSAPAPTLTWTAVLGVQGRPGGSVVA